MVIGQLSHKSSSSSFASEGPLFGRSQSGNTTPIESGSRLGIIQVESMDFEEQNYGSQLSPGSHDRQSSSKEDTRSRQKSDRGLISTTVRKFCSAFSSKDRRNNNHEISHEHAQKRRQPEEVEEYEWADKYGTMGSKKKSRHGGSSPSTTPAAQVHKTFDDYNKRTESWMLKESMGYDQRNTDSRGVAGALMQDGWESLYERNVYQEKGDIACYVGGEGTRVMAYRARLSDISPVLAKQISGFSKYGRSEDVLYFPNYTVDQFHVLLGFANRRQLIVDKNNIRFLLEMENEFGIDFDKKPLQKFQEWLHAGTVSEWYMQTWRFSKYRDLCDNVIQSETEKVIASDSFVDLNSDQVNRILGMDTLCTPELALFQAVVRWIEKEIERRNEGDRNYSPKERRSLLADNGFYKLRLGSMTLPEFTGHGGPFQSNVLTEEEKEAFLDIYSIDPSRIIPFSSIPRFDSSNCLMVKLFDENHLPVIDTTFRATQSSREYALTVTVSQSVRLLCAIGYFRSRMIGSTQSFFVDESVKIYKVEEAGTVDRCRLRNSNAIQLDGSGCVQRYTVMRSTDQMILEPGVEYVISASFSHERAYGMPFGSVDKNEFTLHHPFYQDVKVTVSSPPISDHSRFLDASRNGPINRLIFSHL